MSNAKINRRRKLRPRDFVCDEALSVNNQKIVNLAPATSSGQAVELGQLIELLNETTSTTAVQLPVQDLTALIALPIATLQDKAIILVENSGTYRFDAQSEAAEDSPNVLAPEDAAGAGRWILVTPVTRDGSVQNKHLANVESLTLKGRVTPELGSPEDLTVAQVKSLLGIKERKYHQTLTGVQDSANLVFTAEPGIVMPTIEVFKNGLLLIPTVDYTPTQDEVATTITFVAAPVDTDKLRVSYDV